MLTPVGFDFAGAALKRPYNRNEVNVTDKNIEVDAGALVQQGLAEAEQKIREAADTARRAGIMAAEAQSQSVYWKGRADSYRALLEAASKAEAQQAQKLMNQPAPAGELPKTELTVVPPTPVVAPAKVSRGRRSSAQGKKLLDAVEKAVD